MFKPTLKDMWDDSQFDMKRNNQTFPQINGNSSYEPMEKKTNKLRSNKSYQRINKK